MVERDIVLMKPKHQYHFSNEKNVFTVPNDETEGDYDVNPSLRQLENEL